MPTRAQYRAVDPILTQFGLDVSQSTEGFVQDVLFPTKGTRGETGTYYEFDADERFRQYTDLRADGGEANTVDWRLTKATFSQEEYALKVAITDRERDNALDPISVDQEATQILTDNLMLAREMRARDAIVPSTWSANAAASVKWDQSTATVLSDNETVKQTFHKKTGRLPNLLIVPPAVWATWLDAGSSGTSMGATLNDRLKYTMPVTGRSITPDLVAQLLGVERIVVPNAIYTGVALTNTVRDPGASTFATGGINTGAYVWNTKSDNTTAVKEVLYTYVNPGAGWKSLTLGWSFQSQPYTVFRYREDKLRKDWIEASRVEQLKVVCPACMYGFTVMT